MPVFEFQSSICLLDPQVTSWCLLRKKLLLCIVICAEIVFYILLVFCSSLLLTWVQQTRMAEKMMNEADLEKDVGQNLMQLLGGQAKRRRSSASSLASDESMLSNRYCFTPASLSAE